MAIERSRSEINRESDEISLNELTHQIGEWYRFFLKKWLVIIIFGFIGAALGLTYSLFKKPVYTASTNFVLENSESAGLGQYAGLASMVGIDIDSKDIIRKEKT